MKQPVAITVAGSDSGGGAGIQADLKTFVSLRVHGTSAITCLTSQNPREVRAVEPASERMVRQQIEAVFAAFSVGAVKTGMLYSRGIIEAMAETYSGTQRPPLVVDPVMVATSGAPLLRDDAIDVIREKLLPLCDLVTPNVAEARLLLGRRIETLVELRAAAKAIYETFGCSVLVKGGHLPEQEGAADSFFDEGPRTPGTASLSGDPEEAVDCFFDGEEEVILRERFVHGVEAHGTGCTLSAAITAHLAHGQPYRTAVENGKRYITRAIEDRIKVDSHSVLNTHWDEKNART